MRKNSKHTHFLLFIKVPARVTRVLNFDCTKMRIAMRIGSYQTTEGDC